MRQLIILIASGFYSGYAPFASGTFGTAVAVLLYWPAARLNRFPSEGGQPLLYVLLVVAISALGVWAANKAEPIYGKKDPGQIVIDEIAGFFVTMFLLPTTWQWIAAAFFTFRLFDVWKPGPIRGLQRLPAGWGIMIDDILAGALGCVVLHAIRLTINHFA